MTEIPAEIFELIKRFEDNKEAYHEKISLQRQIDATDKQIELLVYELYGLTEDEVRIVEEKV